MARPGKSVARRGNGPHRRPGCSLAVIPGVRGQGKDDRAMRPKAGSPLVVHVPLALAALPAAVGWWRAADLGGEVRKTQATLKAANRQLVPQQQPRR